MKCQFCGSPAGFMRSYHVSCKEKLEKHLAELEAVINDYNQKKIDFKTAKWRLMDLVSSNELYQKYLLNLPLVRGSIKSNETIIYAESQISISEEKNWKTMERTGLSYARYPTWNVEPRKVADMATVVFSDKAIYLLCFEKDYVYPYSKIVNIDFEHDWNDRACFGVKTTSPHPHKFSLWPTDGRSKEKSQNIVLFLACLCGWREP